MAGAARGMLPDSAAPVWADEPGSEPISEEVKELIEKAHRAVFENRLDEAETLMYRVLEYGTFPAVLNNLALIQLERHDRPDTALQLLNDAMGEDPDALQPFTRALAARCLVQLGRRREARLCLDRAIVDFEAGLREYAGQRVQLRAWREYISKILEAAGELGDDELVWKLYRRWSKDIVLASSHFWGGVAAFNLKRFRAAVRAWKRAGGRERPLMKILITVAHWCEAGIIEPFFMEYDAEGPDPVPSMAGFLYGDGRGDDDWPHALNDGSLPGDLIQSNSIPAAMMTEYYRVRLGIVMSRPANRMMLIWMIFRPLLAPTAEHQERSAFLTGVRDLVAAGGEWGAALARRLFLSRNVPTDVKEAAAQGLIEIGRLSPDTRVTMWLNGKVREVQFVAGEMRVADDD